MEADLLKVWRGGAALSEAWFHLAPPDRWRTFDYPEAARRRSNEEVSWSAEDWIDADEDEKADLRQRLAVNMEIRSASSSHAAQLELKAWLLGALRAGVLTGIGRPRDVASGASLEVIPSFLFGQREVEWEQSELTSGDRCFREVRVVSSSEMKMDAESGEGREKRQPGRPSNRSTIEAAIDALSLVGVKVETLARRDAVSQVLHHLREEMQVNVELPGYSDDTVKKTIMDRFGTRIKNLN